MLARGKKTSSSDKARVAKSQPGGPNGSRRKRKPGKAQGSSHGNGSDQSASEDSPASSSSANGRQASGSASSLITKRQAAALPRLRCYICNQMILYRTNDCPNASCLKCGKEGRNMSVSPGTRAVREDVLTVRAPAAATTLLWARMQIGRRSFP